MDEAKATESKSFSQVLRDSFKELGETFSAFFKAPRALWGINIPYIIEGLVYFGILTILGKFASENLGVTDGQAGIIYSFVTGGITFAMLILGGYSDKLGVRKSLALAFLAMLVGRIVISISGTFNMGSGLWSPMFWVLISGLLLMVLSYGLFQPAAYAGVKRYTNKKTAAMGYAVIYGFMNLGAFFSGFISSSTRHAFKGIFPPNGLTAVFWVYVLLTALSLIITLVLLTRKTDKNAVERVKKENAELAAKGEKIEEEESEDQAKPKVKINNFPLIIYSLFALGFFFLSDFGFTNSINQVFKFSVFGLQIAFDTAFVLSMIMLGIAAFEYIKKRPWHPFRDGRFTFFVFILIPVQTLFAHNWLTLPYYLDRAFQGSVVSQYFEVFTNLNPILIFIFTPLIAGLTARTNVYKMMIYGTLVMALPTFLLTIGPNVYMFLLYVFMMTIGEAMWSPRFLQWIAEIAPEGKVGLYMGVGQFPWFLDKVVTGFYSGYFISKYIPSPSTYISIEKLMDIKELTCYVPKPAQPMHSGTLWFIYGLIAIITPVSLYLAKNWMAKGKNAM